MFILRFVHVNKCGGNSIHMALNRLSIAMKSKNPFDYKQYHDNGTDPVGLNNIKPNMKLFFFVRDPIERFISSFCFSSKMVRSRYIQKVEYKINKTLGIDLDHIISTLGNGNLGQFIDDGGHMGSGLSTYLSEKSIRDLDKQGSIWFVGKTENIIDDFENLQEKINNELGITTEDWIKFPHLNKSNRSGKPLSYESVAYLRDYFASDYHILDVLCELGYLSQNYVDGIKNRWDYLY